MAEGNEWVGSIRCASHETGFGSVRLGRRRDLRTSTWSLHTGPATHLPALREGSFLITSIGAISSTLGAATRDEIDAINEQAWQSRQTHPVLARDLAEKAHGLSGLDDAGARPYRSGQATSLTTLGYLSRQSGELDEALSQCFEAAALLDDLPASRVTVDCQRIISWVYYFLGDTPNALSSALRALSVARDLGLRVQEASVLDAMALIQVASGDPEQGMLSSDAAVEIARSVDDPLLESTILNNRATVLLRLARPSEALDAAIGSLAIARRESLVVQEVTILDTVGEILLAQGDLPRAEEYLQEGLRLTREAGNDLGHIYYLLGLGKLSLLRADLADAGIHLEEGLRRAGAVGAQALEAESHLRLAELYERLGEPQRALEHHRSFHAIHEAVNGELSGRRLAVVNVAHQVETARRDGEIYRLRNVELQREIEERSRTEVELERLAATDPLTNLFNRRRFYDLAQREFARAVRTSRPLAVLMIDLDHFKAVNDEHGHAVGDRLLALFGVLIHNLLREVDVVGRYGGEEFSVVLTETDAAQGRLTAGRVQRAIEQHRFETAAGSIAITVSIGLASLPASGDGRIGTFDQLLDEADQALYRAKRAGRNRVEVAAEPMDRPSV